MIIFNKNQKSKDYSALKDVYRLAQYDYSYDLKYSFRDHRGSGRASWTRNSCQGRCRSYC
nr:chorismate synthase [Halonatronomonas betaini]